MLAKCDKTRLSAIEISGPELPWEMACSES